MFRSMLSGSNVRSKEGKQLLVYDFFTRQLILILLHLSSHCISIHILFLYDCISKNSCIQNESGYWRCDLIHLYLK